MIVTKELYEKLSNEIFDDMDPTAKQIAYISLGGDITETDKDVINKQLKKKIANGAEDMTTSLEILFISKGLQSLLETQSGWGDPFAIKIGFIANIVDYKIGSPIDLKRKTMNRKCLESYDNVVEKAFEGCEKLFSLIGNVADIFSKAEDFFESIEDLNSDDRSYYSDNLVNAFNSSVDLATQITTPTIS